MSSTATVIIRNKLVEIFVACVHTGLVIKLRLINVLFETTEMLESLKTILLLR